MYIPAGAAQANFRYSGADVPNGAEVTLGFDISNYVGTQIEAAETIRDEWSSNMAGFWGTEWSFDSLLLKYGPNATGPAVEIAGTGAGTQPGAVNTPQVAVLIQKRTALGGRKGRGRMYFPPPAAGNILNGGALDGGFITSIQSAIEAFGAAVSTELLIPVLLHGSEMAPTDITSWSVQQRVATQRRRARK